MSHPARESFRQFGNIDPQSRLEEFKKRFDRMKSQLESSQPMFESPHPRSSAMFGNQPSWSGASDNAHSSNGQVPMEKTIPIQVQHERSRSEPVDSEFDAYSNFANKPMSERLNNFIPDDGFRFQRQNFPQTFAQPTTRHSPNAEPRVHHIPIQVESRNLSPSMGQSTGASIDQQSGSKCDYITNPLSQSVPSQMNNQPNNPPLTRGTASAPSPIPNNPTIPARVMEIPIQITKSSSTPEASKKVDSETQKTASSIASSTSNINESMTDPALADPNTVYAMGYERLASNANKMPTNDDNASEKKKETPFDYVKEVLDDLQNYESQVDEFNGNDPKDKGYRFLDEMLTLCVLRLDCINIDGDEELRKYRKSAINEVNRVAAKLETKVSKSNNDEVQPQPQTTDDNNAANVSEETSTATACTAAIPLPLKSQDNIKEAKDKKEGKKLEKAKTKKEKEEKDKESAEKKEGGRRLIFFRSKNKSKPNNANSSTAAIVASGDAESGSDASAIDVDPNNNDLKENSNQSNVDQTADEQASTSNSASSSNTTLKGKETAV